MTGFKQYKVLLIGNPNVGKSALFYRLSGKYVSVSNYPGTTVDITRGKCKIGGHHEVEFIDTPGFYNLITITEEEAVTKKILLTELPDVVLHVIDAKNIERMLPLTLQLIEAGFPVILVLNMFDELKHRGLDIQTAHLEHDLGIPIVATVATKGIGIENLISRIISVCEKRYNYQRIEVKHPPQLENLIENIGELITLDYPISKRSLAILLIQGDRDIYELIRGERNYDLIKKILENLDSGSLKLEIAKSYHQNGINFISENIIRKDISESSAIKGFLDKITIHPLGGLFGVILILYFGFYKFVGGFGAGVLVDLIEGNLFEDIINPHINQFFNSIMGGTIFFDLFAGDYGVITLGIRYALAIVLPVVFSFFLMFSILEDSGYLVRLSMVLDNMLKKIGLSGRSVIPLILGLGCGTMATVVTRTLETVRERYLVTFLLALTIPCAAQLGVILGLLGENFLYMIIWFFSILSVFIFSGLILNRYLKGRPATFFMEIPPLRIPIMGNVLMKTFSRLKWYALEVIPIFIYISVFIWVGKITKIFDLLVQLLAYPARWAGLPDKMGEIFLYGFFRRDFGAAGLFDLQDSLTPIQKVVSVVILTLFVPCVAQFSVMIKERGVKDAVLIFMFVIPFAFLFGILLNLILSLGGIL
ncbi:MAG: ferrous iron transport protein B [Calditerrivibrio sp.]|nr:ferrous iron transport protein B [Calditerrivibrio sp.]MCA1932512.1 ferrous iron transport protein B [Calditerrivibrio sp.]MCA1980179.1 ferrous iron transport protein B [Calditerrivibrio sp.]